MPEDVQGQVPADDTQVVQSDATTDADTPKTFDEEYVKGLRIEAAKYRKELQALKQQQEQVSNATLSEVDRLKKQLETLQKERDNLTRRQRNELMGRAVEKAASKVGVDAELTTSLLATDDLDLDDDEMPKQIEKRPRQLVQKHRIDILKAAQEGRLLGE
jgi:hypothetical protein